MSKVSEVRAELESLAKEGRALYTELLFAKGWQDGDAWKEIPKADAATEPAEYVKALNRALRKVDSRAARYQKWYTAALPVITQLAPERLDEFRACYRRSAANPPKTYDPTTYTISDSIGGIQATRAGVPVFDHWAVAQRLVFVQLNILESLIPRLDSVLGNIKGTLQAEMFDDELAAARELFKGGHLRAAGTLAGVTLERHLKDVAGTHKVAIRKKDPTLAELNDALKTAEIYDVPDWRFLQRLADLRNLCAHHKDRDPRPEEVDDLIKRMSQRPWNFGNGPRPQAILAACSVGL